MTIGERVKLIRTSITPAMTQAEFADSLNISRSNLANLENDRYRITSRVINDICTVYNINRLWLETGEGEMLADMSREEKIGRLIADILDDSPESFRRRVFEILVDLDADGWKKLQDAAELLADKYGTKKDEG